MVASVTVDNVQVYAFNEGIRSIKDVYFIFIFFDKKLVYFEKKVNKLFMGGYGMCRKEFLGSYSAYFLLCGIFDVCPFKSFMPQNWEFDTEM